jgi:hypothetical protein
LQEQAALVVVFGLHRVAVEERQGTQVKATLVVDEQALAATEAREHVAQVPECVVCGGRTQALPVFLELLGKIQFQGRR